MRYPIVFLLILLPFCLQAQEPYHIIYDVKDGLPSSEIYDVEMDDKHNIWFTTDRGVAKYDGYEFQTFTTDDGLLFNTNFEIFEDLNGHFWFGGYDGSLSCFDGKNFVKTELSDSIKSKAKNRWLMQFLHTDDNKYKFHFRVSNPNSPQGTHYEYDVASKTFEKIQLADNNTYHLFSNSKNDNFIYDPRIKEYTNIGLIIDDTLRLIGIDKSVSYNRRKVQNSDAPMSSFNSELIAIKEGQIIDKLEIPSSLRKLYYDAENNLIFVCTSEDLKIWKYQDGGAILHQKPQSILNNISLSSIKKDWEGNTWITSINSGVIFIPSMQINSISHENIKSKKIFSIHPIGNFMLFNDDIGHVYCYKRDGSMSTLFKNPENTHLETIARNDTLNFTNLRQVYQKNGRLNIDTKNEINSNYSHFGIRLKNGDFLYGEREFSVRDDQSNLIFSDVYCASDLNIKLTDVYQDKNENIWLGTLNGLFCIKDYSYHEPISIGKFIDGLDARISKIYSNGDHGIWISTMGAGIFYYAFDTRQFLKISTDDGLVSNIIHCLYIEGDSLLWIGSNKGLEKINYNLQTDKINISNYHNINTTDGLGSNYIYDIKKWGDEIWVANEKGVDFFNPDNIRIPSCTPPIEFDSIISHNQNILKDSLSFLSFDKNDLSFHYTGISFRKPIGKSFYRYALLTDNQDTVWNYTNNRNVPYTNLKAGRYTFIVSARNKYDSWSNIPAKFDFTIKPFYRDTLWFKLLSVMFILGGALMLYKLREKSVLAKEEQKRLLKETEFKLKSAELEALRNQMNPHFIYNTLNSIQNYIFKNEAERANYFLSSFSKLMRKSLEMSKLKLIRIEQEIDFLKNYIELEQMRFENKFDYTIYVDEPVNTNWYIPPLILQPIIENSIKHGFKECTYKGIITVVFTTQDEFLRISISDNGTGKIEDIEKLDNENHTSFGLQIIKNRIQIINDTMDEKLCNMSFRSNIINNREQGIIVTLDLPIVTQEDA